MAAPGTLGDLRRALAALAYLPDSTPVTYTDRTGAPVRVAEMGVTVDRATVDALVEKNAGGY